MAEDPSNPNAQASQPALDVVNTDTPAVQATERETQAVPRRSYHQMLIDTDPEENLRLFLDNAADRGFTPCAVLAVQPTPFTRGYLVIYSTLQQEPA